MKKLLNNTILRNCQYYKVKRYNSEITYNLTFSELETFKQKNDITYYFVIKPSRQKAVKIHNLICDITALSCFSLALILLIDILLKTL
jgi:mannose-6-phosphate isomerase class I